MDKVVGAKDKRMAWHGIAWHRALARPPTHAPTPRQNTFRALYRSFRECCFIEDDGDIVFYKNQHGEAQRFLAGEKKPTTDAAAAEAKEVKVE